MPTELIAYDFEPAITLTSIRVLTPFWPTKDIDPKNLFSVGDWAMSQNLYSNLVEVSAPPSVRPALAESWTQSPDGLVWIFSLRKNLKWSDGTPMTSKEIIASLRRSVEGTIHTKVAPYLESIEAITEDKIKFVLKTLPENFLTNLAFVDFAVVHPKSYENGFSWSVKSSGPYRVKKFSDDVIELEENAFYWEKEDKRPKNIILGRIKTDVNDINSLISKGGFNAAQMPLGLVTRAEQLAQLENKYDIFHGNVDFNALFMFSKKRIKEKILPIDFRRYLLCETQRTFWKGYENHPQRATGLRPPGVRGALDLKEFEQTLDLVCSQTKTANFSKPIEILIADSELNRPLMRDMVTAIRSVGFAVSNKIIPKKDFYAEFYKGNFDVALLLLGASEDDPDSSWRIYQSDFPESPTDEELNKAQIEKDPVRRNQIYKEIEKRMLRNALFIPLKNEYTYILTDHSLVLDRKQASDWGLQLYKLKFK